MERLDAVSHPYLPSHWREQGLFGLKLLLFKNVIVIPQGTHVLKVNEYF
jgi:hypothetical protein